MAQMDEDTKKIANEFMGTLRSSLLSIDGKFFDRNQELLSDIQTTVRKIGRGYTGEKSISKNEVSRDLSTLILNSLGKKSTSDVLSQTELNNRSGIRSITQGMTGTTEDEQNLIAVTTGIMENIFRAIPEYRNIDALIPEISRVVAILARDIVNKNEFTGRSIQDSYESDDPETESIVLKAIRTNIIEPNELETKVRPWLEEALVSGAKPIALIPYAQIIKDVVKDSTMGGLEKTISMENWNPTSNLSYESFSEIELLPMSHRPENKFSMESANLTKLKKTISHDLVSQTLSSIQDDIRGKILKYGSLEEAAIDPKAAIEFGTKKKSLEALLTSENASDEVRKSLDKISEFVADNVIFNSKRGNNSFSSFKKHVTDQDFKAQQTIFNLDGMKEHVESTMLFDVLDKDGSKKAEKKNVKFSVDFASRVLVLPLNAEHVIPIIINSRHVGYYIVETQNINNVEEMSRTTKSFTDIVKSIGYNTDSGVTRNDVADVADTSDMYSNYSNILRSKLLYGSGDQNSGETRLNKTLQEVALRAIATRLGDSTLIDNKAFQDSTIELIRRGYILGNQVMYTYIPAENLIYYSPREDGNGFPRSILDGCLMDAYIYISSIVSSLLIKLMKSADKEKVIVNMGLSKDISGSIQEIDRFFSTRHIAFGSMFQNLASVLRYTGQYQRNVIPSFDGNLLYDLEGMERINDVDIDDEFTTNRLNSILSKMGVPPSILNLLNDSEFSRSIVSQHLEYRNNIVEYQNANRGYKKETERMIRRLITLMGLKVTIDGKTEQLIEAEKYSLDVRPPLRLEIEKSNDEIDQVSDLVDKLTTVLLGELSTGDAATAMKDELKRDLFKKFFTGIEWEEFDERYMKRLASRARQNYLESQTQDLIFAKVKAEAEKRANPEEPPPGGSTW